MLMQNKAFNQQFSERLREIMIQRGYGSASASSGVSPTAICKAIDCYSEMAIRYLDGRSIPTPENILKLSEWLQVEPGYLLFGDAGFKKPTQNEPSLTINKALLAYVLGKAFPIVKKTNKEEEFLAFLLSFFDDLSYLSDIEVDRLKKIVDMTFVRDKTFNPLKKSQQLSYFA